MKENKYDEECFFNQYSQMLRSLEGLKGAGEWPVLKAVLPDFQGKRVLDLGCGFGWHCRYAIEHGALSAVGIDLSEKMIKEAKKRNAFPQIEYRCMAIEDLILSRKHTISYSVLWHFIIWSHLKICAGRFMVV